MHQTKKVRLDTLVVQLGLAATRDQARRLIRRGAILVDEVPVDKPGAQVFPDSRVRSRYKLRQFVSRGGEKLAHALDVFRLSVEACRCADLGASTGGFVDCLLQRGASVVYAVDVGTGLLHERLRTDARVVILDRTNARFLTLDHFGGPLDVVTADLSFISLRLVLPAVRRILSPTGWTVALVKPQFEIGKGRVGKGGIVRRPEEHQHVLERFVEFVQGDWCVRGLEPSPVPGKDGNIEFLAWLEPGSGEIAVDIAAVVEKAHAQTEKKP